MFFLGFYFIAQAVSNHPTPVQEQDFIDLFWKTYAEGEAIDAQWLSRWNDIFTLNLASPGNVLLYPGVSLIAVIIAVLTACFLMVRFGRELMDSNFANALPELIWPLVAVFLLSFQIVLTLPSFSSVFSSVSVCGPPGGSPSTPTLTPPPITLPTFGGPSNNLATIILEIRNVIDLGNRFVMTTPLIVGNNTACALQRQAQVVSNGTSVIQGYFKECSGKPPGSDLKKCYLNAASQSYKLVQAYEEAYQQQPWTIKRLSELEALYDGIDGIPEDDPDFELKIKDLFKPGQPADWVLVPESKSQSQQTSLTFQTGFRQMLEAAQIFTGLAGPIAVAVSLLPVPFANKAVVTWATGFLSIGAAKIFYNIVVGVAASVLVQSGDTVTDPGWFVIFLGYVAPVFALGLATGGGVALWNGLQSGVSPLLSR
jgi:hypothetical protein